MTGLSEEVRSINSRMGTMENTLKTAIETDQKLTAMLAGGLDDKPGISDRLRSIEGWKATLMKVVWMVAGHALTVIGGLVLWMLGKG